MAISDVKIPFFDPDNLRWEASKLLIEAHEMLTNHSRGDSPDVVMAAAVTVRLEMYKALHQEAALRVRCEDGSIIYRT